MPSQVTDTRYKDFLCNFIGAKLFKMINSGCGWSRTNRPCRPPCSDVPGALPLNYTAVKTRTAETMRVNISIVVNFNI